MEESGDSADDIEARALLNKFLGASVLMSSIESSSGLAKDILGGSSSNKQNVSATNRSNKKFSLNSCNKSLGGNLG